MLRLMFIETVWTRCLVLIGGLGVLLRFLTVFSYKRMRAEAEKMNRSEKRYPHADQKI